MPAPRRMSVVDRIGETHGRLTVVSRAANKVEASGATRAMWNCKCECGGVVTTSGQSLSRGLTRSCGCLAREKPIKHGKSYVKVYRQWTAMKQRTTNPKNTAYGRYGGRGITLCAAWHEFENFYRDMGNPPHSEMTIERIDNDKGYEPGNVRWATRLEQASNTRANKEGNYTGISRITYAGETLILAAWSSRIGTKLSVLRRRLNDGWSVERAIETPHKPKGLN
jgi:hypothetical protein